MEVKKKKKRKRENLNKRVLGIRWSSAPQEGTNGRKVAGKEGDEARRGRGSDNKSGDHRGNICRTGWIERVNRG